MHASLPRMPRTVNGTGHTGPSEFCATSIELFYAGRHNAVLRRSPFSTPVKTFLSRSPRSDERFRLGLISYQKASDEPLVTVLGAYKCEVA